MTPVQVAAHAGEPSARTLSTATSVFMEIPLVDTRLGRDIRPWAGMQGVSVANPKNITADVHGRSDRCFVVFVPAAMGTYPVANITQGGAPSEECRLFAAGLPSCCEYRVAAIHAAIALWT
jgi:hypothetical protein